MRWFYYVITFLLFFVFSLLQSSFFPYFAIWGAVPNLVFCLFFTLIFFEPQQHYTDGFFAAIMAGLFADMFLPSYFGVSTGAFLVAYITYKIFGHFLRENQQKHLVFYFMGMFSLLFLVHQATLFLFSLALDFPFSFGITFLVSLVYGVAFAMVGFYIGKKIFARHFDNQLKLF